MNKIEEIKNKIIESTKELEELKKEKSNVYDKNWIPKLNENYWYISDLRYPVGSKWEDSEEDNFAITYLKIFNTEKEAKEYLNFIRIKKEYSYEFTQEEWEDFEIGKYCIYYDFNGKSLCVVSLDSLRYVGEISFKSKQEALEFIDKYEKQILKYDIGIKEV